MKRSEINQKIRETEAFIKEHGFHLPPFCNWTPEDWKEKGEECREIVDNMLGWDITDYGLGDFDHIGLTLVTIRNGNQNNPKYTKPYAEKLLISEEDQICPMHFHWSKMEDIINRGGGILMMELYNSTENEELDTVNDVIVVSDGVKLKIPAGTVLEMMPGQSVTLTPGLYHRFWAKKGCGKVLIGEVSKCNDDNNDNRFLEPIGRFPTIEEDEPAYRLLCNEYPL
ncbi:MAG: D-lyxose/D-mannose family sugar isomerase [Clostridia bacterium]|jgi:D-lyxose ketol-isomerase|nr:D-lyxose/D-mannose family sugar isomerase [Clostridia bacterium]MBQ5957435.1 D-lyxose/D-mannose family sugar isomerase [Clostridia bacterium]MBR0438023.1 D-lyxose/D-mannose family sugar isomerase [Clostridia bacterium]MBR3563251.1 D-lyxose/D-mannose family sugar isomerase [Clostridia bacterium]MBR4623865.1 D-lyxose/D-mannose family sugar isomerase [Clostridia bacterium]